MDKKNEKAVLRQAENYFSSIVNYDLSRVDKIRREPERTECIMRSYARLQGTQATLKALSEDISTNDREKFTDETISSYLSALRKIFVIEDMKAWNQNLKSKTAIRTSDTRYYIDPSIGVAALGLGPHDLINDKKTFGLFFETLCIRDLRVNAVRRIIKEGSSKTVTKGFFFPIFFFLLGGSRSRTTYTEAVTANRYTIHLILDSLKYPGFKMYFGMNEKDYNKAHSILTIILNRNKKYENYGNNIGVPSINIEPLNVL